MQGKRLWLGALVLVAASTGGTATASPWDGFGETHVAVGDGVALGLMIPLDATLMLIPPRPRETVPTAPQFDLELERRSAWEPERRGFARVTSDVLLLSFIVVPLAAPAASQWDDADAAMGGSLVTVHALLASTLLNQVVKHAVRRPRPSLDESPRDGWASFYSGHTATAFAGASLLTIQAYEYRWGANETRWLVPASTFAAAAVTGWLRMAGRKHWATDVLVGAVAGTGAAFGVWALRD